MIFQEKIGCIFWRRNPRCSKFLKGSKQCWERDKHAYQISLVWPRRRVYFI